MAESTSSPAFPPFFRPHTGVRFVNFGPIFSLKSHFRNLLCPWGFNGHRAFIKAAPTMREMTSDQPTNQRAPPPTHPARGSLLPLVNFGTQQPPAPARLTPWLDRAAKA